MKPNDLSSGTERGRENTNEGTKLMNPKQLRDDTEPRSVDQQQACSALLALLPVCDEYDNGESWTRGMVLSDAIALKNTWFWRTGDPWLGGITNLITDLAVPSDWVEWRGDGVALIRVGNVMAALTYAQDSRYECFALAWPNDEMRDAKGEKTMENTQDKPAEAVHSSAVFGDGERRELLETIEALIGVAGSVHRTSPPDYAWSECADCGTEHGTHESDCVVGKAKSLMKRYGESPNDLSSETAEAGALRAGGRKGGGR